MRYSCGCDADHLVTENCNRPHCQNPCYIRTSLAVSYPCPRHERRPTPSSRTPSHATSRSIDSYADVNTYTQAFPFRGSGSRAQATRQTHTQSPRPPRTRNVFDDFFDEQTTRGRPQSRRTPSHARPRSRSPDHRHPTRHQQQQQTHRDTIPRTPTMQHTSPRTPRTTPRTLTPSANNTNTNPFDYPEVRDAYNTMVDTINTNNFVSDMENMLRDWLPGDNERSSSRRGRR